MKLDRVLFLLLTMVGAVLPAAAQVDLTVRGAGKLFPVAVPQLCVEGDSSPASREIPRVLARDLNLSGFFEVLNPSSYIESPGKCAPDKSFAYSDWSVIGAEGLVKGVVSGGSGRDIVVKLYLHDVQRQKTVLGKEYRGDISFAGSMAHKFANEIMKFFTGIYGVFGTRIAYSSKIGRFKELFVMDMDGSNIHQLTNERGLAVSAAWTPDGKSLIFTSYRKRIPDLFLLDPFSRRQKQITSGPALEVGVEPDKTGERFLVSLTSGGESDIVLMDMSGKVVRKLTRRNGAIDVSPSWSPDNRKLAFCSNRSGTPQIYTMNADGSSVRRISFATSRYCTSPAWSPRGDKIAYVCRADRGFQLFVADTDGSDAVQLTSYGSNEDPSWSPNGEYIVFSSTFGKGRVFNLALIRPDGSNLRQLTFSKTDDTQPVWGPLSE